MKIPKMIFPRLLRNFKSQSHFAVPIYQRIAVFLLLKYFNSLTRPERVNVLILDDSVIKRNRSKSVELLVRVYDHVEHKCQRGFTLLTLGWSDGYSFIPTGFNMLSSANKSNRYNE
ncbi:MAG: transposase, partial [Lachnospiraceae bacterium]|nr:transposase [Lachnospiraceae bacterium]